MAPRKKATVVNLGLLFTIAAAPDGIGRISKEDFDKLSDEMKSFVEVNTENVVEGKAAVRLSEAGKAYVANASNPTESESKGKPMFGILSNIPIPASNRGNRKGAGAPTQYPFETMEIGQSFFVGNSQKEDAAKKLGSTVSQQNMKYSIETGETKEVERTKRGDDNKALTNPDGSKVKEKVTIKVRKQTRKYVLRAVKKDQVLGDWTAPEDGALIARVKLDEAA